MDIRVKNFKVWSWWQFALLIGFIILVVKGDYETAIRWIMTLL